MEEKLTHRDDSSPIVERFLRYKLVIQGRSQKTVNEYALDLRTFFRYLIAVKDGINPSSDEFNEISIASVDEKFVKNIKTIDILEKAFPCILQLDATAAVRIFK